MNKEYIGDGVYIHYNGEVFVLTTENGISTSNIIIIEFQEMNNIQNYVKRVYEEVENGRRNQPVSSTGD